MASDRDAGPALASFPRGFGSFASPLRLPDVGAAGSVGAPTATLAAPPTAGVASSGWLSARGLTSASRSIESSFATAAATPRGGGGAPFADWPAAAAAAAGKARTPAVSFGATVGALAAIGGPSAVDLGLPGVPITPRAGGVPALPPVAAPSPRRMAFETFASSSTPSSPLKTPLSARETSHIVSARRLAMAISSPDRDRSPRAVAARDASPDAFAGPARPSTYGSTLAGLTVQNPRGAPSALDASTPRDGSSRSRSVSSAPSDGSTSAGSAQAARRSVPPIRLGGLACAAKPAGVSGGAATSATAPSGGATAPASGVSPTQPQATPPPRPARPPRALFSARGPDAHAAARSNAHHDAHRDAHASARSHAHSRSHAATAARRRRTASPEASVRSAWRTVATVVAAAAVGAVAGVLAANSFAPRHPAARRRHAAAARRRRRTPQSEGAAPEPAAPSAAPTEAVCAE